jgi:hypothetical protein
MGIVRSQHLGDAVQAASGDILFFTAGDTGVTVVKGLTLGCPVAVPTVQTTASILCQFSGGNYVPLLTGFAEFGPNSESITTWIVMTPGSQLFLRADGIDPWFASADGAVLQDT